MFDAEGLAGVASIITKLSSILYLICNSVTT